MIAIFGLAGSGKSLQGQILAGKYGWRWLSVGQLLRDQNDPEIAARQKTGELVDDELVIRLMHEAMGHAETMGVRVILDGYPRDEAQAKWMAENGDLRKIRGVIVLNVPREELWKRIVGRGRVDDTEEAIVRRWEIFEQNSYSILPLFEAENVKITTVDGVGSVEEITTRIEEVLVGWGMLDEAAIAGAVDDGKEMSYGE